MNKATPANRLLRLPSVMEKVAMSRSQIYRRIAEGTFPAPLKLSQRSIAWNETSIDAWINSLAQAGAQN